MSWAAIRPHNRPYPQIVGEEFSVPELLRRQRRGELHGKDALLILIVHLEKKHQAKGGGAMTSATSKDDELPALPGTWTLTVDHQGSASLTRWDLDLYGAGPEVDRTSDLQDHLAGLDLSWATPGHAWEMWMPLTQKTNEAVQIVLHDATSHDQELQQWKTDRRWCFQRPRPAAAEGALR